MIIPAISYRISLPPADLAARIRAANVGGSYAIDALADLVARGEIHGRTDIGRAYLVGAAISRAVAERVAAEQWEVSLPYPAMPTADEWGLSFGWGRTGLLVEWDESGRPYVSAGWHGDRPGEEGDAHPRFRALAGLAPVVAADDHTGHGCD